MPLKTAPVWGAETAAAIQTVGVAAGTPVTPAQLIQVWTQIKSVTIGSLALADVAPGSFLGNQGAPIGGTGGPIT